MNWKLLSTCCVLLLLGWRSFGAALPQSVNAYSVQIYVSESGKRAGALGSGFILQASNSVYLVTARHVLFEKQGTNGWQLKFPLIEVGGFDCHLVTNDVEVLFDLNLNALRMKGDVRHSENQDIALVRFGASNPTDKRIYNTDNGSVDWKSPSRSLNLTPAELLVKDLGASSIGLDIYLFGYPSSVGFPDSPQIDYSHPLMRKGIMAGLNPKKRTIILDCPIYQGNSGGPVLMKEQTSMNTWQFRIIGIAVEWIPFSDVWESKRFRFRNEIVSNSGYSVAETSEMILEMVWQ